MAMISAMGGGWIDWNKQGCGGGEEAGGERDGERKDLTLALMEEQIQELQQTNKAMQKELEGLKAENKRLNEQHKYKVDQDKEDKGTLGRGDKDGRWGEGEWRPDDPWKGWNGGNKERKGDDARGNDDGKGDNKYGRDVKDERGTRVWWGGSTDRRYDWWNDRRNEMVMRGFRRNMYWKEIKSKGEDVMKESGITYRRVKVIGEKSSFAIIQFYEYDQKQDFKRWLESHGAEALERHGTGVKAGKGLWFGDNVDKEAQGREKAVGKVKLALIQKREGRTDVYRDYKMGKVWVGDVLVARWDVGSKRMQFRGEGETIREEYERLMAERKGEVEEFAD